jgi:hypothetical protein
VSLGNRFSNSSEGGLYMSQPESHHCSFHACREYKRLRRNSRRIERIERCLVRDEEQLAVLARIEAAVAGRSRWLSALWTELRHSLETARTFARQHDSCDARLFGRWLSRNTALPFSSSSDQQIQEWCTLARRGGLSCAELIRRLRNRRRLLSMFADSNLLLARRASALQEELAVTLPGAAH